MKEAIQKYFKAWLNVDIDVLSDVFSNDIIYSECYGPEYHGISQILKWFDDWNQKGKVLEWTIKRSIEKEKTNEVFQSTHPCSLSLTFINACDTLVSS